MDLSIRTGLSKDDQEHALTHLFPSMERQVAFAQALAEDRQLARGLHAAFRGSSLVGAIWSQCLAGSAALVIPARVDQSEPVSTQQALYQSIHGFLKENQIQLAQALLPLPDSAERGALEAAGYDLAAELIFMRADFFGPYHHHDTMLTFHPYHRNAERRMIQVMERTYEATLDCPMLNNVRQSRDVLAGYRATGTSEDRYWYTISHQGQDVGCLILADHANDAQTELVYMGLVPEARERGLGLKLVRFALGVAFELGRTRMVLGVDAQNLPALLTYQRVGFREFDRRLVMIKSL